MIYILIQEISNLYSNFYSCPEPEEGKKLKVTMVAWDASDRYVITAVNDFTVSISQNKFSSLYK